MGPDALAMQPPASPEFDEWVRYCFTLAHADSAGESTDPPHVVAARESLMGEIEPVRLTEYLIRLFEAPAFLAGRYSADQIADGIWFLYGCGSEYINRARDPSVPRSLQTRCIRSIATCYTDLFERICSKRADELDEPAHVDIAVFMIWDMGNVELPLLFAEDSPGLLEPTIEVLEIILQRCRANACLESALHGAGHAVLHHRTGGDGTIALRMKQLIDRFLISRDAPDSVREYALRAREGAVQ